MKHGIILASLLSYIEDAKSDNNVAQVLKMADLANLYSARVLQLGVDMLTRVHTHKLNDRILANFTAMKDHKQGRDVI